MAAAAMPTAASNHSEGRGVAAVPRVPDEGASPRASILVVDDDRQVGRALARTLGEHDVTVVTEGRMALHLLESGKDFDVIFSDVMMPGMSGVDLYEELARRFPRAAGRVVFMTGGFFRSTDGAFLDRVANPRMSKPFTIASLLAVVETFKPFGMRR